MFSNDMPATGSATHNVVSAIALDGIERCSGGDGGGDGVAK